MINRDNHTVCNARNHKARQYRRLYLSCLMVFFVITLFERLLPQQWRFRRVEAAKGKSIVEDAKEQAGTFVPYLFMNY